MAQRRVVITGAAVLSPFGDTDETLKGLQNKDTGIDLLPEEFKICATQIGGLVEGPDLERWFDQKTANRIKGRSTKPSQFSHIVIEMALRNAGLLNDEGKIPLELQEFIGISLGTGVGPTELVALLGVDMYLLQKALGTADFEKALKNLVDHHRGTAMQVLPDASAYLPTMHFGIRGPTDCSIKACATGAGNIRRAFMEIRAGNADFMVAGGTESLSPIDVMTFNVLNTRRAKTIDALVGALSKNNSDPRGASRPFDQGHDGFVPSEGAGVLVLEGLRNALRRRATILGEIVGYGETTDAEGTTDPTKESQERAIRMALYMAGLNPDDIDAVSTHGTSTIAGDGAELLALRAVFGARLDLLIYAIKSQLGHMLGASGAVAAAIAVLSMQAGWVPGTINLENPISEAVVCDKDHDIHTPACYLTIPSTITIGKIKYTLVNSFGFGGQNVCLIIKTWE